MEGGSSKEISENLKKDSRTSKIQEYGDEKLPVGDVSGKEVIVVEGRADVVNLLANRVNNVIGMNGTKLPKGIIELSKEKEITLFADGDRGGKLIAKNVMDNAEVAFIAFAPDGKEVEELSGKEILASLRKKIPAKEFSSSASSSSYSNSSRRQINIDKDKLMEALKEVEGSKKAFFFDRNLRVVKKFSVGSASRELGRSYDISVVGVDGKATSALTKAAQAAGVQIIAAKTFADAEAEGIEFVSF
jgi:DNA primase